MRVGPARRADSQKSSVYGMIKQDEQSSRSAQLVYFQISLSIEPIHIVPLPHPKGEQAQAAAETFALDLASRGSETQTTVPTPSVERSFIEPPCRLASDFAIARPRPEP